MQSKPFQFKYIWLGLILQLTVTATHSVKFLFSHSIHPGFDNYDILPPTWVVDKDGVNPIGAIAMLPDGRMVTTTWTSKTGSNGRNGQAFILSGVLTATTRAGITVATLPTSLREPLGMTIVNGSIYVVEKDRLGKFTPNGANWTYSVEYDKANAVAFQNYGHWFSMGLVYYQGKFNWTLGGFHDYGNYIDSNPERHGTWVQYDPVTKTHEYMVYGMRNTGGTSLGPDGTICTTDNQGDWEPSDKFICMEKGNWYGFDGPTAPMRKTGQVESPPTSWGPHDEITNSMGDAILMPKGKYAGQMFITDLTNGVINRIFMEKVRGHWQGAFTFVTAGFKAGPYRIILAPDSTTLIVGCTGGGGGGWKYLDTAQAYSGLHKLVPNNNPVLEILAVRSMSNTKMEVQFTEPVNPAAALAAGYTVTSWKNISSQGYGQGRNSLPLTHTITNVTLSADNLRATLTLSGLEMGRIVRIFVNPSVKALSGDTLWFKYSDYTMTNFGPAEVVSLKRMLSGNEVKPFQYTLHKIRNGVELKMSTPGAFVVEAWTMQGTRIATFSKAGPFGLTLTREAVGTGVFMLRIKNEAGLALSEKVSML